MWLIDIDFAFGNILIGAFAGSIVVVEVAVFSALKFLDESSFWPSINLKKRKQKLTNRNKNQAY